MADHLPECPIEYHKATRFDGGSCICDRLRAAEQRVGTQAYQLGKTDGILLGQEQAHRDSVIVHEGAAENRGYRKGRADALADAREAVFATTVGFGIAVDAPVVVAYLAAIDALAKGEQE